MNVLVLDCDCIFVTDLSELAGKAIVLCSSNSFLRLPIINGERTGLIAPKLKNGADFMLIAMLTECLLMRDVNRVAVVTKDVALGGVIEHLCKLSDVDCSISSTLEDFSFCTEVVAQNKHRHQQLKQAVFNLFIVKKRLTLFMIKIQLAERPSSIKRVVDELAEDGKIRHLHGQHWQLAD